MLNDSSSRQDISRKRFGRGKKQKMHLQNLPLQKKISLTESRKAFANTSFNPQEKARKKDDSRKFLLTFDKSRRMSSRRDQTTRISRSGIYRADKILPAETTIERMEDSEVSEDKLNSRIGKNEQEIKQKTSEYLAMSQKEFALSLEMQSQMSKMETLTQLIGDLKTSIASKQRVFNDSIGISLAKLQEDYEELRKVEDDMPLLKQLLERVVDMTLSRTLNIRALENYLGLLMNPSGLIDQFIGQSCKEMSLIKNEMNQVSLLKVEYPDAFSDGLVKNLVDFVYFIKGDLKTAAGEEKFGQLSQIENREIATMIDESSGDFYRERLFNPRTKSLSQHFLQLRDKTNNNILEDDLSSKINSSFKLVLNRGGSFVNENTPEESIILEKDEFLESAESSNQSYRDLVQSVFSKLDGLFNKANEHLGRVYRTIESLLGKSEDAAQKELNTMVIK
jgi:hypothetical protein